MKSLDKPAHVRLPAYQACVWLAVGSTHIVDLPGQYQWAEEILNKVGVFMLDGLVGIGIEFSANCEPWEPSDRIDGFPKFIKHQERLLVMFIAHAALAEIPAQSNLAQVVHNCEVACSWDHVLIAPNNAHNGRGAKARKRYSPVYTSANEALH